MARPSTSIPESRAGPTRRPIRSCSPVRGAAGALALRHETGAAEQRRDRRPASYWYKTERTGSGADVTLFAEEERDDLPLVNRLREDVKRWRESGTAGRRRHARPARTGGRDAIAARRLFFCQREAVETIIYLAGAAASRDVEPHRHSRTSSVTRRGPRRACCAASEPAFGLD